MPFGQTNCILCPKEPPPPLTGEHIWPDWYSEMLPNQQYELETILAIGDEPTYEPRNGIDLKPEVLCGDCNSRWGATFENKMKPLLWPMSQGQTQPITQILARKLAGWACLKAMVAEHLVTEQRQTTFFSQAERAHLRSRQYPPPSVKAVWLGRYVGERNNVAWLMDRHSYVPFSDDPPTFVALYVQTLSIGQLIFQTLAFHDAIPLESTDQTNVHGFLSVAPGEWSEGLIRIVPGPPEPVSWPPPKGFDEGGFDALNRRWHQRETGRNPREQPAGQMPDDPAPERSS